MGVLVVLSCHALLFVDSHVLDAVAEGLKYEAFYPLLTKPVLLQVALGACIWAMCYLLFQWVRVSLRERRTPNKVLVKARGTILTETLIVFPVFLLLTSGLAQLSINTSASILTAVGTFQANRTAWLWEPETRPANARNGMSGRTDEVDERARIAAASVIAPVVPAEFRGNCDFSDLFDARMRTITATGAYAGAAGADAVRALVNTGSTGLPTELYYNKAFDTSPFYERGAKKLYLAYCLTSASHRTSGGNVVTTVEYTHANVFPWFSYIFGEERVAAGNPGRYAVFTNTASLPQQIDANPREPMTVRSTINGLVDDFFSGFGN